VTAEEQLEQFLHQERRDAGFDLPVFIRQGVAFEHRCEQISGYHFKLGVVSPHYMRGCSLNLVLARVLVCEDELVDDFHGLVPIMEQMAKDNHAMLVVAPRIDGEVAEMFVANHTRNTLQIIGVDGSGGPELRPLIQEICSITGTTPMSPGEQVKEKHLGHAQSVWTDRHDLLITTASEDSARDGAIVFHVGGENAQEVEHLTTVAHRLVLT
jgi:chaperonin GroEL (HSP60 family)